jgi:hypothetical protein
VADADVSQPIDDVLVIEDAVGNNEIVEQRLIGLRDGLCHG